MPTWLISYLLLHAMEKDGPGIGLMSHAMRTQKGILQVEKAVLIPMRTHTGTG